MQSSLIKMRYKVLDCWINCIDMQGTVKAVLERMANRKGGYVCFSNVHTVVTARSDVKLREITNQSFLSVADGKPLYMVGKYRGLSSVGRVAGPDFMPFFIQKAKGLRHFFFGSTPETLEKLVSNIRKKYPEAIVCGSYSPPFGKIAQNEMKEALVVIRQQQPDIIWVGLGAPKQEYWMADYWQELKPAILMGVGAAFDLHAGRIPRAPEWMRKMSLEWFYRVHHEPRRLWKRYLITNSLFLIYFVVDVFKARVIPR